MKKIDAVFCDIDGTLVDDNKVLHQEEIEAVKELVEKGIPFIPVSGRLPSGMTRYLEQIGIEPPVISFGGGLIVDENGKTLFQSGLDRDKAVEIYKFYKSTGNGSAFNFYKDLDWFTNDLAHPVEQWEANSIGFEPVEADIEEVTKSGDVVSKCLFAGDPKDISELEPLMRDRFPELRVVKSLPNLLEIIPKNVSKSEALEFFSDYYNYDLKNCVAIGDNFNDIDMLEVVGEPIIMANAPDELKKLGKVTDSNNDHGVSKAIKELLEQ